MRTVHPMAWWGWAIGLAISASLTTNPALLGLLAAVISIVVAAHHTNTVWGRSFKLYVWLGALVIVMRVIFHLLIGLKYGDITLFWLPTVALPTWAAGIQVGGTVYLEGLLNAVLLGLRLAVLILAVGAANALANPKRLLRAFPRALHEIGTAVVVAISVAPQLAESVQRVMRARQLRGDAARGLKVLPKVAIPVLQDTLDRSLMLASAMESRGYGGHHGVARPRWVAVLTLGGLLLTAWGLFGLLNPGQATWWTGSGVLVAGVLASVIGLVGGGKSVRVSTYRPDRWGPIDALIVGCAVVTAVAMMWTRASDPASLTQPLQPLGWPAVGLPVLLGILVAALPAAIPPAPKAKAP